MTFEYISGLPVWARLHRRGQLVVWCALLVAAGCQSLQLPARYTMTGSADWPTAGGSFERRHVTMRALAPPLSEAWSYNARAGFGASASLLMDEVVLVATRQGEVHAIDLDNGNGLGHQDFGDAIEDAPTLRKHWLYVPVAWKGAPLVAYDLRKGEARWKAEGAPISGSPLLHKNKIIVARETGTVSAYSARKGRLIWKVSPQASDTAATVRAAPVGGGGSVLVADVEGRLRALDASSGECKWTRQLPAPVYETPAADDDVWIVSTTRGRLYAINASSGQTRWQFHIEDGAAPVRLTSPAVDENLVVVAGSDGMVHALRSPGGDETWSYDAQEAVVAPPLLTPNYVYVGTMGGMLIALNRQTGKRAWKQMMEERVRSLMSAGKNKLIVLTEPHDVHLLTAKPPADDARAHR